MAFKLNKNQEEHQVSETFERALRQDGQAADRARHQLLLRQRRIRHQVARRALCLLFRCRYDHQLRLWTEAAVSYSRLTQCLRCYQEDFSQPVRKWQLNNNRLELERDEGFIK